MGLAALAGVLAVTTSSSQAAPLPAVAAPPVNTSPPTIQAPAGQSPTEVTMPQVGRILIGTRGGWTGANYYEYQWEHCDTTPATAILGAVNTTYHIASTDVGHTLCLLVRAFTSPSSSSQATSAPSGVVAIGSPVDRSAPTISGLARVGRPLTSTPGVWDGSTPITYTYQWRRCDSAGARCGPRFTAPSAAPTYLLQNADAGHTIVAYVTATNSAGSSSVHSRPTPVVASAPATPPAGGQKGHGPAGGGNGARVRRLLLRALAVHGSGGRIGALLRHGGYELSFSAPSPGRLVVAWLRRAAHGKAIRVATLNVRLHRRGTAKPKLVLTGKGRRLLRGARRIKLTATGRFTPAGQRPASASRRLTLRR